MSACSVRAVPHALRIPVKVNGISIPHAAISREAQNHPAPTPTGAWKAAALALVLREALAQEATRLSIPAKPRTDTAGRRETDEEARMRALIEREAFGPEPTEEECRRYYERHLARFRSPDLFEPAHILFAGRPGDVDAFDEARNRARQAIAELRADPLAFEHLAKLYSACPSREAGGHLGQIVGGQTTPEFDSALRHMSPGEISAEPVETRYGIHVIRLDRRIEGRALPFDAVRQRIADYLRETAQRRAQAGYAAQLLGRSRVEGFEVPSPGESITH